MIFLHFCLPKNPKKFISSIVIQTDVPARGGGGGLLNGLNSDDLDDDDYVDEDSEELLAIRNTGNRLGGDSFEHWFMGADRKVESQS